MKLIVIIATAARRALLAKAVAHLEHQLRPPDEVIISAPDESHVGAIGPHSFPVNCVFGKSGLTAQRNIALDHALGRADIITFFDDDFLPANDYLKLLEGAFEAHRGWAVIRGHAVIDGANGPGLTFEDGLAALRAIEASRPNSQQEVVREEVGGYGCNMSVRAEHVGSQRFDERLVLYGWQEDIDFTSQLRSCGEVVSLSTLLGVHLGAKSGRVSGLRFGYSQLVNPVYLMKKGTMPAAFALELMARNFFANLGKSFWSERHIDRRGRLKGNILAACHIVLGRIEPERVLKL